ASCTSWPRARAGTPSGRARPWAARPHLRRRRQGAPRRAELPGRGPRSSATVASWAGASSMTRQRPSFGGTQLSVSGTAQESMLDLIVIGGGVNGTGVARDAALRGFRVALFERNDLGFGASGNNSGLIHGG